MALVLNEEQTLLNETAAQFFKEQVPISNLRKLRDSNDAFGIDRSVWKECANLGFAGVMISETYGGSSFGPIGLGLILEQAGKTLSATPFISTVLLCGSAIQLAGNSTQRQEYLPAIAAGERICALALEERAHHNPTHIQTTATQIDDGFSLNGTKTFVLDGHIADQLIVAARTSGAPTDQHGITLFLVSPKSAGVSIERTLMADSRNAAKITFTNVKVREVDVLGSVDGGSDVLDPVLDMGRIGLAAETLGLVQAVFDQTIVYLKERKQFGEVIGSFQALKHRAAEMFSEIEVCRSIVLEALTALEEKRNDVPHLASLAKAKLSEVSRLVTNEGLQMHGGVGMTDEYDLGLFMKRARVAAVTLGDANFHRDRYATLSDY